MVLDKPYIESKGWASPAISSRWVLFWLTAVWLTRYLQRDRKSWSIPLLLAIETGRKNIDSSRGMCAFCLLHSWGYSCRFVFTAEPLFRSPCELLPVGLGHPVQAMLKSFTAMSGCASRGTISRPQEVHIINLRGHEAEGVSNTFPEVSQLSSFPKCFLTFNKSCAFYSVGRPANYLPRCVDRRGRILILRTPPGSPWRIAVSVTAVWKAAALDLSLWFCCWWHTETVSVRVRRCVCCTRMSFRVSLCLFSKFTQWTKKKVTLCRGGVLFYYLVSCIISETQMKSTDFRWRFYQYFITTQRCSVKYWYSSAGSDLWKLKAND